MSAWVRRRMKSTSQVMGETVQNRISTEMETSRSGKSVKTSKTGGKRAKAVTVEEEARRRESLKEALVENLALEKRALKVVESLLEDSVAEDFLVDCARLITPANYSDAVEERSIAKLCGYPICPNKLGKVLNQKYKISTKTNKVYDITERKCFCSNFCYKASKEFELQISNTPLWLKCHESPPSIRLVKKGDGGSFGEEVMLSDGRLQEQDIEDTLATQPEDLRSSRSAAAELSHSDNSDFEQDFVSSVVSQQQQPRVHWGDLPKRTDEEDKGKGGKVESQKTQRRDRGEEAKGHQSQEDRKQELHPFKTGAETDVEKTKQPLSLNTEKTTGQQVADDTAPSEEQSVEDVTCKLNVCSLSETDSAPPPVDSTPSRADLLTSPACKDSNPSTESKHSPSSAMISANQDNLNTALTSLKITQVGMSKRGAAGLRDLLKKHAAGVKPDYIRLTLLECLRKTFMDWCTEATVKFLYGADQSASFPFVEVRKEKEEELDEDDLDDEDAKGTDAPSAPVPDYKRMQEEAQTLDVKVKEFYKGTWILPEGVAEEPQDGVTVQDQRMKDPVLPLVDSNAQHLIQKRITVEKLTSCLKNIVGPLRLTMSDISSDLNNLVRTFKFTNTNIIHKTPEWTLIAIVLLHLLSEVSPLVREALEMPASVEYLNTLLEQLGLCQQDLLSLVNVFKAPAH